MPSLDRAPLLVVYSGGMSSVPTLPLPPAALQWLVGAEPVRVVTLGCSRGLINRLIEQGHGVIAVDPELTRVQKLTAGQTPNEAFIAITGRADELPVQPCVAHVVLIVGPWRATPGRPRVDAHLAHGQVSRALQAGGWAAGWRIVRDDSVPWVRRLIALMRSIDPTAMPGASGTDHEDLLTSKYFPRTERRDFRLWQPVTRRTLVEMVTAQHSVAGLDEPTRRRLLAEVNQILDSAARMSELALPYQMQCWRAHVDHHELTQPITFSDGALVIPI